MTKEKVLKKKILFISHSSQGYGSENSLIALLEGLNKSNITPIVILPSKGILNEKLNNINIKTYNLRLTWWIRKKLNIVHLLYWIFFELVNLILIFRIIKKYKVDLIYSNTAVVATGALAAKATKIKHIWHIREIIDENPDLHSIFSTETTKKIIDNLSTALIFNSKATQSYFAKFRDSTKMHVVYNGFKFNSLANTQLENTNKKQWTIAVIGYIQTRKAQHDAIIALNWIKEKIPNVHLLLIGGSNVAYKTALQRLISNLELEDSVHFVGFTSDINKYYAKIDCLIVPSWKEPFGRVIVEAMNHMIPIVGTNSGGIPEIICDNQTGFLVEPKNPYEIYKKVYYIYTNKSLVKRITKNAYNYVRENFAIDTYVNNIYNIITSILNY